MKKMQELPVWHILKYLNKKKENIHIFLSSSPSLKSLCFSHYTHWTKLTEQWRGEPEEGVRRKTVDTPWILEWSFKIRGISSYIVSQRKWYFYWFYQQLILMGSIWVVHCYYVLNFYNFIMYVMYVHNHLDEANVDCFTLNPQNIWSFNLIDC